MGIHAISHPAGKSRHELSIFPLCLTVVALSACPSTFSMLARAPFAPTSVSAAGALAESAARDYTGGQFARFCRRMNFASSLGAGIIL